MKKQLKFTLALAVAFLQASSLNAAINHLLTSVDNIVDGLNDVAESMERDITFYNSTKTRFTNLQKSMTDLAAQRLTVFACIKAQFDSYKEAITACESTSSQYSAELDAQLTKARNALISLTTATNAEITQLQGHYDSLTEKLESKLAAYKTLSELDQEKTDRVIASLAAIRTQYAVEIAKRTEFISLLDPLAVEVSQYTANKDSDIAKFTDANGLTECVVAGSSE